MNYEQTYDLPDCTEFRRTLLAKPPRFIQVTLILFVALVATVTLWAALTKADLVVRARGRVRPMARAELPSDAASEESRISPVQGGRVVEVHAEEGDRVRQGDVLVRFDTVRLDNDIAKQRQFIQNCEQELGKLEQIEATLISQFQAARAKVEAELAQEQGKIEHAKRRRDCNIRVSRAALELAQHEMRLCQKLAEKRAISEVELVRSLARCRKAELELEQTQLPLDEGRILVLQQELQLVEKEHVVALQELDLTQHGKRNELAVAKLDLADWEWQRRQSELVAPSDGTVTTVKVAVGDIVETGQSILCVAEQRGFRFDISVTSEDVTELREGMKARIKLDGCDEAKHAWASGRVVFISPDSRIEDEPRTNRRPTYLVRINIDDSYVGSAPKRYPIRLGMAGEAEIVTVRQSVILLLLRSVRRSISLG